MKFIITQNKLNNKLSKLNKKLNKKLNSENVNVSDNLIRNSIRPKCSYSVNEVTYQVMREIFEFNKEHI